MRHWRDALTALLERIRTGGGEAASPASDGDIRDLDAYAGSEGIELPSEYRALLRVANGLHWNGLTLYASRPRRHRSGGSTIDGVVEANMRWRRFDELRHLVVLAEDSTALFALDARTGRGVVISQVGLDEVAEYPDLTEMLAVEMDQHL
ncbi:MAG: YrhA family protein [Planctomycetota bacterium]